MNKYSVAVAFQKLQARIARLNHNLTSQDLYWLWRSSLLSERQPGFVLPTTILLLLMLSLVLAILVFRAGTRNAEVIGDRQQRQLYNAATPAMDRAKAKLEFLFTKEPLPPLPSDRDLAQALRANTYTLQDENRLNLDGDPATVDPAWTFDYNVDGDPNTGPNGKEVTIAYSLLSLANATNGGQTVSLQDNDALKSRFQVVRNGPIDLRGGSGNPNCANLALSPRAGWQPINSATLRKALQVNAYARNNQTGVSATLEMQQDRQANFGNKWGAWFRYDLELHPGPTFRWNGAMHSEANMFISRWNNPLSLYLVSSPNSCIYTRDASEITVTNGSGRSPFRGHIMSGKTANDQNSTATQTTNVHRFADTFNGGNPTSVVFSANNDSVRGNTTLPTSVAIDPVLLLTEDRNRSRNPADPNNENVNISRDATWAQNELVTSRRMYNDTQPAPYLDDTYRADNRWGPKPQYTTALVMNEDLDNDGAVSSLEDANGSGTPDINKTGDRILSTYQGETELTREDSPVGNETQYGFDGYWERRAMAQGVRLIVGQRLELGNAFGWIREDSEDANGNERLDPGEDTDGDGFIDPLNDLNGNRRADLDPLNPPPADAATGSSMVNRAHEQRQWRTLRDNLAAVQTTAVYHYLINGGSYPAACLASTTHPGTDGTRLDSRTFESLPEHAGRLDTNFLTGKGTNGIEFSAPFSGATNPEVAFANAINNDNSPLRRSLTNLARFAGDPAGGFPAQQDTVTASTDNAAFRYANFAATQATGVVHPYPQLTMWGDFSNLRRVIAYLEDDPLVDNGNIDTYEELSPADRTTLQTATCTLGALAYNLQNQEVTYNRIRNTGPNNRRLNNIGNRLFRLMDGHDNNGEIGTGNNRYCNNFGDADCPSQNPYSIADATDPEHYSNYYQQFTPEDWVTALRNTGSGLDADIAARLEQLILVSQTRRDRALGFAKDRSVPGNGVGYTDADAAGTTDGIYDFEFSTANLSNGQRNRLGGGATVTYPQMGCDPNSFAINSSNDKGRLALAMALCSVDMQPKYPSLYYLFPLAEHAPDGGLSTAAQTTGVTQVDQPQAEPYVSGTAHPYIFDRMNTRGINCRPTGGACRNDTFRPVGDTNNNGIENAGEAIGFIRLRNQLGMLPRLNEGGWVTPVTSDATGRLANNVIQVNGTSLYPAFFDTTLFNGREMLALRAMDIDFDLLRRTRINGSNRLLGATPVARTDYWLPLPDLTPGDDPTRTGAVIYAFREDNVREDAIARPRRITHSYSTWLANWLTYANNSAAPNIRNYLMNAVGQFNQQNWNSAMDSLDDLATDPPVNPRTGISPKSVDFYPDPDRRPNGFRLRNGSDLRRLNGGVPVLGTDIEPERRGVALVTDNPVYIQSDSNEFNVHTEEEFDETLNTNWSNFYQRSTLNVDFASRNDQWRSMEIISDAITVLSASFNESTIERGITNNSPGSFNGMNRNDRNMPWVREDQITDYGLEADDRNNFSDSKPIKISRHGFPVYCRTLLNTWIAPSADPGSCEGLREFEFGREGLLTSRPGEGNRPPTYTFLWFNRTRRSNNTPANSRVNAVMVSGVIPSRNAQSSGGLHNFPRFIEDWNTLFISGSFIQLNFSNSATGQTDQDSWEPGQLPDPNSQRIGYYSPPDRRWGYDVALQFAPAGSVSERFVALSSNRSEFYRELPVEDPYIVRLRCARPENGGARVDTTIDGNGC